MKSISDQDMKNVSKVLSTAFHGKEHRESDDLWRVRVMGHIRSLHPLYPRIKYLEFFQQFVWKIAPVACILVLLLGVAITRIDFVSDYKLTKLFMEDPADLSLMTLYDGKWG